MKTDVLLWLIMKRWIETFERVQCVDRTHCVRQTIVAVWGHYVLAIANCQWLNEIRLSRKLSEKRNLDVAVG